MSDAPVCGMLEQREMRVSGKSWSAGLAPQTWSEYTSLVTPHLGHALL